MFDGTSKTRLILWSIFWAVLFLSCWTVDTLLTRFLAVTFLIVAGVLAQAARQKIKRDAEYRELANTSDIPGRPIEPPDPAPNSRHFGPPPPLNQ